MLFAENPSIENRESGTGTAGWRKLVWMLYLAVTKTYLSVWLGAIQRDGDAVENCIFFKLCMHIMPHELVPFSLRSKVEHPLGKYIIQYAYVLINCRGFIQNS